MTRFLRCSLRVYRSLLIVYPDDLRRDFGAEILEAFAHDLSAECAARGIKGGIGVWRTALRETIRIGLPAWVQIPAVAVPAIASAMALVTQSPLLILTVQRQARLSSGPGDATPLDALFALAIEVAVTALTSFAAVYRWKRASLISLDLGSSSCSKPAI
jgi:hypothetical protein